MKNALIGIILALPSNLYAHTDTLDSNDPIGQVIANCESERDSQIAQAIGADKHVEACVLGNMSRIGKLKRYREKYPTEYEACHRAQPYGLSATVICIESQI